ncbi:MAG TPA: NAD(P)-binding domain-containing protein [Candidatus Binatia bacterium]
MQIAMVGLGRMGANMVRRLLGAGHQCVVFDMSPKAAAELTREKAVGSSSLADLVKQLHKAACDLVTSTGKEETTRLCHWLSSDAAIGRQ